FESNKTRKFKMKSLCMMPSKQGIGYRLLVRRENGAALFGAWCALIQFLSRNRYRYGFCTDNGLPPKFLVDFMENPAKKASSGKKNGSSEPHPLIVGPYVGPHAGPHVGPHVGDGDSHMGGSVGHYEDSRSSPDCVILWDDN